MRLIDADELKSVFTEKSTEAVCGAELCKAIISRIDDTPTIDAVPVDFIRSEIERMKEGSNRYYSECEVYAEDLDILLMEWERRQ